MNVQFIERYFSILQTLCTATLVCTLGSWSTSPEAQHLFFYFFIIFCVNGNYNMLQWIYIYILYIYVVTKHLILFSHTIVLS